MALPTDWAFPGVSATDGLWKRERHWVSFLNELLPIAVYYDLIHLSLFMSYILFLEPADLCQYPISSYNPYSLTSSTLHHTTPHHTADAALVPSQSLPIWSVALPQVATTETNGRETGGLRLVSGKDKILFADVVKSFLGCKKLLDVRTLQFPHSIPLRNLIVTCNFCTT